MAVNHYKPHVVVLVEDRANADIANGFLLEIGHRQRNVEVSRPCGGWLEVLKELERQFEKLDRFPARRIVLVLDFDDQVENRTSLIRKKVPEQYRSRIFLLGCRFEPERLRTALGLSLERIGSTLSRECSDDELPEALWLHDHLSHNDGERRRLRAEVADFLLP